MSVEYQERKLIANAIANGLVLVNLIKQQKMKVNDRFNGLINEIKQQQKYKLVALTFDAGHITQRLSLHGFLHFDITQAMTPVDQQQLYDPYLDR